MTGQEETTYITVTVAARRSGLTSRTVRRYARRGLVSETLTEGDLTELRRIRRLTDLGVNLAGVEIILRMRRRIKELQSEIDRLQTLLNATVNGSGIPWDSPLSPAVASGCRAVAGDTSRTRPLNEAGFVTSQGSGLPTILVVE